MTGRYEHTRKKQWEPERVHLIDTARGLTASSPSPSAAPGGRWREQDPLVGAFQVRIQEGEAKATESDAKLYALEAEVFKSLAQLSDKDDAAVAALAHQLGEHGTALLSAQEDAVTLKAMIDTLASGSGPAAAPTADPWWTGRRGPAQGGAPTGPGGGGPCLLENPLCLPDKRHFSGERGSDVGHGTILIQTWPINLWTTVVDSIVTALRAVSMGLW